MSTITLPNIRVSSDLTVKVRLKDSGVAIDWSTLTKIKASIYSDAQRALAGRCDVSIDAEDSTLLVCNYAANKPQYVGVNRIVVSAKYMGETKTYDKPAFNFVRWTADQEGEQITIDDPDVDVEISVEDISSSILQEAVDAAFEAADRANDAAAAAEHMVDIHTGPEGKSAYEVAVEEGYVGTEEEWLASLVGPQGQQGIQGETGEAAGFGTVSVSLQEDGGQPSATVAASGTDTAKNFAFTFNNLKGDKGDQGNSGYTGAAGELEVVNNLTDGGAAKALSAEMGKTLEGEVSQLEAKVVDINFGPEVVLSNNILAPEAILDKTTKYIRRTDGVTIQSSGGYGYTDFIPIDERGLRINNGMAASGAYGVPTICYDANKNFLRYWPYNYISIDSADGTAYVRFNLGDPSKFAEGGALAGQDYAVYRSLDLLSYDVYKTGRKLKEGVVEAGNIKDKSITKEKLSEETWNKKADGEYVILSTNVLDPAKITNPGYYISNDGVTLRSGGFGTSDFIPRKGEAVICYKAVPSYGVYQFPILVYDADKQFLRVQSTPYYDWREGDAYVRFNLGDPSGLETPNYQVNYIPAGTTERLPYEQFRAAVSVPDNTILTSKLVDKAVTFEKIGFQAEETGKNKFNKNTALPSKYIDRSNGSVGTFGGFYASDYIPVSEKGLYCNHYYSGGVSLGAAVYDAEKRYLRACPNPYVFVEGDAFVRYSIESENINTTQVEVGSSATSYEEYSSRNVIDPNYIPTMPEEEETPAVDVFLPDRIFAVVGDTIQLFFKGMVKAVNALNYNIYVVCSKGQIFHRYWQYTPSLSDVGTATFRVTVRDNNGNTIASKSCSLVTVATPTSPATEKKVVCVGASETANGTWPAEVGRRLVGTGGTPVADGITNVRLCGTKTKDGFGFVGNSGWGWSSYATSGSPAFRFVVGNTPNLAVGSVYSNNGHNYYIVEISDNGTILCETSSSGNTPEASGVLTKVSGSGDASVPFSSASLDSANPFWDYTNNKLTFIPFANAYCDGVIDVMYILLGINGNAPFKTDFSAWEANMKAIADTLHSEFPDAKLVLLSYCFPSMELMMPGYGANGGWADTYGMLTAFFNEQKFYQEFANDADYSGFVDYVALAPEVDSDNNFPITMKDVNTRNNTKQEPYANNTIHAGNAGYLQIADAVYRHIVGVFLQS